MLAAHEVAHRTVDITDLFPTQVTVGLREVNFKRRRWRDKNSDQAADYLATHRIPVILGPENRHFIIDRHHLARALHDEGVKGLPISILATMNTLNLDEFWSALECRGCTHPFDGDGRQRAYNDISNAVCNLIDDPFRSLAGALKRAGGYTKNKAPFSEFRWADFLRRRIDLKTIESNFDHALGQSLILAMSCEAAELPGWRGRSEPT